MFVNEYTLKKLYEERNEKLEKAAIEKLERKEKINRFANLLNLGYRYDKK
jgi:hypothetical protein